MFRTPQKLLYLVAGARPNFMKIAPVVRALHGAGDCFRYEIIHTGQHYDREMSDVFFEELGIPQPDHSLNCGGGSHAEQTARIMVAFEGICQRRRPDCVLVVGDVNSTLACSIVAKKLHLPVAHVEAGLRSGRGVSFVASLNTATGSSAVGRRLRGYSDPATSLLGPVHTTEAVATRANFSQFEE